MAIPQPSQQLHVVRFRRVVGADVCVTNASEHELMVGWDARYEIVTDSVRRSVHHLQPHVLRNVVVGAIHLLQARCAHQQRGRLHRRRSPVTRGAIVLDWRRC